MERPAPIRWAYLRHGSGKPVAQSYKRKEPVVKKDIRFVGLDVHAETIAVAVAEADGDARSLGVIPNRPEAVRRLGQEARACRIAAGLLRGGTLRLRAVLATERAGRALRCG